MIPVLNLNFPKNALSVDKFVVDIIAFDLIQSETISNYLFNFSEPYNDVYSENFNFLRMDSFSAIMILGPEFYMFAYIIVAFLIIKTYNCVQRIGLGCVRINNAIGKYLKPLLTANGLTRIGLQTYMCCGFAGFLGIQKLVTVNLSDKISAAVAVLCLTNFILFPLLVILILIMKHRANAWKKNMFKELYKDNKKDSASRIYHVVYLFRRFMLVFTPFMTDIVVFQIAFAVYIALICTCYLVGVKPLINPKS